MEMISSGHFKQVFEIWGKNIYSSFNQEFIKDKKLNVHYFTRVRYKNNRRHCSDSNTECMLLEFDPNLSTDFVFSEVDLLNETALELKIIEADQPRTGRTKLTIESQYTNEKQELFLNIDYIYCETVGGTITKRLAEYKKAFDKFAQEQRLKKFKLHKRHVIEQLGMHIYNNYIKGWKTSYQAMHCNRVLIIFSILNNNCLEISERFQLWNSPWYVVDGNFNKYHECSIQIEYAEKLKKILEAYTSKENEVSKIINESVSRKGSFNDISYSDIKPKILELFKELIE